MENSGRTLFEQYFFEKTEFTNLDLKLDRIDEAVRRAAPWHGKAVHIAGTNGKGSTSYFIAQLLEKHGKSTLLFTSPHIQSPAERIALNLERADDGTFDELFIKARPYAEELKLSYFETVFLMAMILAQQEKPDYLVLETGLGGRYDATNTRVIDVKTPVIASISQDHKHILGAKISDIASEKLAIVRGNEPVFIGHNPDFIIDICMKSLPGIDLRFINKTLLPQAQAIYPDPYAFNYMNAHNVAEYLLDKNFDYMELKLPPCRQERFGRIMLDGAHNISGLVTLLDGLKETPEAAVITNTADRDLTRFCNILSKHVGKIILTTIPGNHRSVDEKELLKVGYEVVTDPVRAVKYALADSSGGVLVAGSLYLCAIIRNCLVNNEI